MVTQLCIEQWCHGLVHQAPELEFVFTDLEMKMLWSDKEAPIPAFDPLHFSPTTPFLYPGPITATSEPCVFLEIESNRGKGGWLTTLGHPETRTPQVPEPSPGTLKVPRCHCAPLWPYLRAAPFLRPEFASS